MLPRPETGTHVKAGALACRNPKKGPCSCPVDVPATGCSVAQFERLTDAVLPWNLRITSSVSGPARHYHEHDLNMTLNADFSNNLGTSTARQNLLPPLRFLDERIITDLIGLHQLA